jgi:hypothetical protein
VVAAGQEAHSRDSDADVTECAPLAFSHLSLRTRPILRYLCARMPGPSNSKRKSGKGKQIKNKPKNPSPKPEVATFASAEHPSGPIPPASSHSPSPTAPLRPPALEPLDDPRYPPFDELEYALWRTDFMGRLNNPQPTPDLKRPPSTVSPIFSHPCLEQTASGLRVRDVASFLVSPFSSPPASEAEAPLCAELAQEEVLDMMRQLLPDDVAVVRAAVLSFFCAHNYTADNMVQSHTYAKSNMSCLPQAIQYRRRSSQSCFLRRRGDS